MRCHNLVCADLSYNCCRTLDPRSTRRFADIWLRILERLTRGLSSVTVHHSRFIFWNTWILLNRFTVAINTCISCAFHCFTFYFLYFYLFFIIFSIIFFLLFLYKMSLIRHATFSMSNNTNAFFYKIVRVYSSPKCGSCFSSFLDKNDFLNKISIFLTKHTRSCKLKS